MEIILLQKSNHNSEYDETISFAYLHLGNNMLGDVLERFNPTWEYLRLPNNSITSLNMSRMETLNKMH